MFPEEITEVPTWLLDLLSFDRMERFLDSSQVKTYFTKASFLPIMKGVIAMLDSNGRFLNTMGTGTGKTAISILICCISSLIMVNVRDHMIRQDDTRKDQMTRDIDETCIKRPPNRADYDRSSERRPTDQSSVKRPRKGARKDRERPSMRLTTTEELFLPEDQDHDQNETLEEIREILEVTAV